MTIAELGLQLASHANPDGGWPYAISSNTSSTNACSWTEPTAYALLALNAAGVSAPTQVANGLAWLSHGQRSDGGWTPQPAVAETTWVTALAALVPGLPDRNRKLATTWLMEQTPANATAIARLRDWMLGNDPNAANDGWPWYPETAAWVSPTCLTIIALRHLDGKYGVPGAKVRIQKGTEFLLSRACAEGGWNHGSSRALGYNLGSYPETTGLGLVAASGAGSTPVRAAIAAAQQQATSCRSVEGRSWLRLGLLVHGVPDPAFTLSPFAPRTTMDLSLSLLAALAAQGKNAFAI